MSSQVRLSKEKAVLIIPTYNHGIKLRAVVEKALAAGWQTLVIDDGSTDGGLNSIADLAADKLILPHNMGKGAAIIAGARWAREHGFEAVISCDADGQLDPAEADILLQAAAERWPAIVVGDRQMQQSSVPGSSIFGRKFSNFWVKIETGLDLPDTQSGFRLYPLAAILDLPVKSRRYDFEIEILVRAAWAGFPIYSRSVSVDYPPAEKRISHFHKFKDNLRLTKLHSRLVLLALLPIRHKRLFASPPRPKTSSLFQPIKLLKEICREHDSTIQLAAAAWLGIFLGALPLIAVHTIVIIYVSHKLHLNKVAAVAASQLCVAPVMPVLCIQTGFFLRYGHFLTELNWQTLVVQIPQRFWEYFLGAMVLGPILGVIIAAITYLTIAKLRQNSEPACEQSGG